MFGKWNKGLLAGLIVLAVILAYSLKLNYDTRLEKQALARKAVPALVRSARLAANERQFADALDQVNVALEYAPDHADARLLKGQLLIVNQRFAEARAELEQYLRQRPADAEAGKLLELCGRPQPEGVNNLLAMAQVFVQQQHLALADGLLMEYGPNSFEARKKLEELFQKQVEAAWPGLGNRLTMDTAGTCRLNLRGCTQIASLDPLAGMPLTSLDLGGCSEVQDLAPLKGMPLTWLDVGYCGQVQDSTPLHGLPLTWLNLQGCGQVQDLTPLHGMQLKSLNLWTEGVRDLTPLEGMSLVEVFLVPRNITKGMDVLRRLKMLKTIHDGKTAFPPDEFWTKYDAGEFSR
jgi:hypothetical protein